MNRDAQEILIKEIGRHIEARLNEKLGPLLKRLDALEAKTAEPGKLTVIDRKRSA